MNTNNSTDIIVKGSIFQESAFLLVTKAIDKIMIGGDDITQDDLVISKLLGQDIIKYRSLFPHVSAAYKSYLYHIYACRYLRCI
jgi:DNA polymerase elongation subunit (family B)